MRVKGHKDPGKVGTLRTLQRQGPHSMRKGSKLSLVQALSPLVKLEGGNLCVLDVSVYKGREIHAPTGGPVAKIQNPWLCLLPTCSMETPTPCRGGSRRIPLPWQPPPWRPRAEAPVPGGARIGSLPPLPRRVPFFVLMLIWSGVGKEDTEI